MAPSLFLANWTECLNTQTARKIQPNLIRSRELRKTAERRAAFLNKQKPEAEEWNFVFEGYYASLLELLHAISYAEGFSVSNHLCLEYYVRDVLKDPALAQAFHDCRAQRNKLVYYGNLLPEAEAKKAIEKAKRVIEKLSGL